jgi:hypothetical protein
MTLLLAVLASAPTFTERGTPIHPKCVSALVAVERAASVQLATCGAVKGTVTSKRGELAWVEPGAERPESASYRVLGVLGGDWVVWWTWSGGGSGQFSGVSVLHAAKGTLRLVRSLTNGDRCNGGVVSATLENGRVRYSVQVTPLEVLGATIEGKALTLDSSQLESSALSCFATLEYLDGELVVVSLDADGLDDRAGWTERYRLQSCYNLAQRRWVARGATRLDRTAFAAFVSSFREQCLERAGAR